jgi:predicted transcriptional regulator
MKKAPHARDMMQRKPVTLVKGMRLREAAHVLAKKRVPSAPVIDNDGNFIGFFSVQSLMVALVETVAHSLPRGQIESYLTEHPPTVDVDASVMRIVNTFAECGHEHAIIAVQENGKLVGTLTRYDVIESIYNYFKGIKDEPTRMLYLSALRGHGDSPFASRD